MISRVRETMTMMMRRLHKVKIEKSFSLSRTLYSHTAANTHTRSFTTINPGRYLFSVFTCVPFLDFHPCQYFCIFWFRPTDRTLDWRATTALDVFQKWRGKCAQFIDSSSCVMRVWCLRVLFRDEFYRLDAKLISINWRVWNWLKSNSLRPNVIES